VHSSGQVDDRMEAGTMSPFFLRAWETQKKHFQYWRSHFRAKRMPETRSFNSGPRKEKRQSQWGKGNGKPNGGKAVPRAGGSEQRQRKKNDWVLRSRVKRRHHLTYTGYKQKNGKPTALHFQMGNGESYQGTARGEGGAEASIELHYFEV